MYPWSNSVREGIWPIRVTIFIDNVHSGHRKYYSDLLALLFKLINKALRTETACSIRSASLTVYIHFLIVSCPDSRKNLYRYLNTAFWQWDGASVIVSIHYLPKTKGKKMCLASFGIQLTTFLPQNLSKWANTWIILCVTFLDDRVLYAHSQTCTQPTTKLQLNSSCL